MCAYIKAITAMLKFKKKLVQYHLQMKTKDSIEEWLIKNKIRKNIFNFFFSGIQTLLSVVSRDYMR